jgi:hypothetical protein
MNASFGLDHPLFAVNDIEVFRNRLILLGFNMTSIGRHPWGTSTSLAMFDGCLFEIMSIYDEKMLDEVPAGNFRFGRHVHQYLTEREGIALTALHSTDSVGDAVVAKKNGFQISGHLEFSREVVLPDGTTDKTKTTLAIMPDQSQPRLSLFLCQQHRPDLIYVTEWLNHANTVCGIAGATILCSSREMDAVVSKFSGVYGSGDHVNDGWDFKTANGDLRIRMRKQVEQDYGPLASGIDDDQACFVAMDMIYANYAVFKEWVGNSDFSYREEQGIFTLLNPEQSANTFLRFLPKD